MKGQEKEEMNDRGAHLLSTPLSQAVNLRPHFHSVEFKGEFWKAFTDRKGYIFAQSLPLCIASVHPGGFPGKFLSLPPARFVLLRVCDDIFSGTASIDTDSMTTVGAG